MHLYHALRDTWRSQKSFPYTNIGFFFCLLRAIIDEKAVIRFATWYVHCTYAQPRISVNAEQNGSLLLVLASRVVLGLGSFGTNDHIFFVPRPLKCSERSILRDLYELNLSFNTRCSFSIYRSIFALILVSQTFTNCYSFIEIVVTSSALLPEPQLCYRVQATEISHKMAWMYGFISSRNTYLNGSAPLQVQASSQWTVLYVSNRPCCTFIFIMLVLLRN